MSEAESADQITITLPDGSARTHARGVTGAEIAADIGPGLAKAALAVKVDGEIRDLARPIESDAALALITIKDDDALELIRHDAAHVLAEAVQEIFPGTQITFGPATEDGFYYDFHREEPFSTEDFETIEKKMEEIVGRDEEIIREVWSQDQVREFFVEQGE
ncbi:MAG: TGS domain-containing protein, partial [Alphaproteobacteria bacterium]|nr:TGS domain-containing protein [Alphaproteobacteria bacterium]